MAVPSQHHEQQVDSSQGLPDLRPYLEGGYPLLIVLSGPSGVGKDAVVKRMQELGYPFHFVITATTRPPRQGERQGVDYFFLSEREFEDLIHRGELFEHALVYGEYKGIPKEHVRHALASGQVLVFLIPGSEEELFERLRGRNTEDDATLQRRVATIHEEMKRIPEFDYVVVNRDGQLDQTAETIAAIIRAEKCRTKQRVIRL
jgi:guanylate kinase